MLAKKLNPSAIKRGYLICHEQEHAINEFISLKLI